MGKFKKQSYFTSSQFKAAHKQELQQALTKRKKKKKKKKKKAMSGEGDGGVCVCVWQIGFQKYMILQRMGSSKI
jgi:hypothetical protein